MHTTLNLIRAKSPCTAGWKRLLTHLNKAAADDEPLSLLTILESNGLEDALWCLRATPDSAFKARMFAVFCARQVQHLNPDPKVKTAIDTAERFAHGEATEDELRADAAYAAGAANAAAYAAGAADAAYAAADAAYAAAYTAARAVARAVADAAYAASEAASAAAYTADRAVDRAVAARAARAARTQTHTAQVAHFKHLFQD